jgi:hypothetical protein
MTMGRPGFVGGVPGCCISASPSSEAKQSILPVPAPVVSALPGATWDDAEGSVPALGIGKGSEVEGVTITGSPPFVSEFHPLIVGTVRSILYVFLPGSQAAEKDRRTERRNLSCD